MRRWAGVPVVKKLASIGAGLGLVGAGLSVPLTHAALAGSNSSSETFYYTGSQQTFTVPMGVTQLDYTVAGGAGGAGYAALAGELGGSGGDGSVVTGTLTVTPGEQLIIEVGSSGANASSNQQSCGGPFSLYVGGAGGSNPDSSFSGGSGGDGNCDLFNSGGGGGGGGAASAILDSSNAALVVAAGGGGGGGAGAAAGYDGGAGGANASGGPGGGDGAGSGGQIGAAGSSAGGTGGYDDVAGHESGGGGGGGGGLDGGDGGSAGQIGGGGGGGGGSGSSTTGSGVTVSATNNGNGYVTLSWSTSPPPRAERHAERHQFAEPCLCRGHRQFCGSRVGERVVKPGDWGSLH